MPSTTASEFVPFPKIARLSRDCIISEKLDGTNASIKLEPADGRPHAGFVCDGWILTPGSRNRWLSIVDDNYGFANWVYKHAGCLTALGEGHHFGEWWGAGIQRGYGLEKDDKRFSLFNSDRWSDEAVRPACCSVVPVLYRGLFETSVANSLIQALIRYGSSAVPGFMDPEGIVVYHTAAGHMFKKTCKGDEQGKSQENHVRKERPAKPPRDKSKGGRRIADLPYSGEDRRVKS